MKKALQQAPGQSCCEISHIQGDPLGEVSEKTLIKGYFRLKVEKERHGPLCKEMQQKDGIFQLVSKPEEIVQYIHFNHPVGHAKTSHLDRG